jgi:hypothetical protein
MEKYMKEWLLDCFPDDADQEEIESLSREELMQAIRKYYDGGLDQFYKDTCEGIKE